MGKLIGKMFLVKNVSGFFSNYEKSSNFLRVILKVGISYFFKEKNLKEFFYYLRKIKRFLEFKKIQKNLFKFEKKKKIEFSLRIRLQKSLNI